MCRINRNAESAPPGTVGFSAEYRNEVDFETLGQDHVSVVATDEESNGKRAKGLGEMWALHAESSDLEGAGGAQGYSEIWWVDKCFSTPKSPTRCF